MMNSKLLFLSLITFSFLGNIKGQKGKDGAKTITNTTTPAKVNEFTALTVNALVGATTINVAASSLNANGRFASALAPGDLIMIIQMQGAMINLGTYAVSWQPDFNYGKIWDYANCGNYEFAQVKSILSGTQIEIDCDLKYNYTVSGKTQIVRVPRYTTLDIGTSSTSATLTTDAWLGTTGGVLAVEVDGNTTINNTAVVTTNALGFRGGVPITNGGTGNNNFVTKNPNDGAEKGEGIGSQRLTNTLVDSLGKQCKGAPANGGGGGDANNCGGGGGGNGGNIANYIGLGIANTTFSTTFELEYAGRSSLTSSGGGKGGYGTSTTTTISANSIGPDQNGWGSFKRPSHGGYGGRPLDYTTGKLFMGGGGGAGHTSGQSNGTNACAGGNGGGIIYFLSYGNIAGSGNINSNGANGNNAFGSGVSTQGIDGSGGGGAGGTIFLDCASTISAATANANGGNGGNQVITTGFTSTSEGQGPGGGGSGGYIASNGNAFAQNVFAGINGVTNATAFDTEFPMNGATSGDVGTKNQTILNAKLNTFSLVASPNQTICTGQVATLTATTSNSLATINWYNSLTGGAAVATGTAYTTPVFNTVGVYTVYAGFCPGTYRKPIIITVNNAAVITIASQTICAGKTATLTPTSSATSYSWSTTQTTNAITVSPASTTNYTVYTIGGSCSTSQTVTVTVNALPILTVTPTNTTICSGTNVTLLASGATTFTWSNGINTSSQIVTPTTNTVYTVNGTDGNGCTNTLVPISNFTVTTTPTISLLSQTICPTQTATFTANGATSYTWLPTSSNLTTYTVTPIATQTVTLIGANGTCTSQATASVTIGSNVTIGVNNPTICVGQTATLTATGISSYTWSNNSNLASITITPNITTTYTISGNQGLCSGTQTATVTVIAQPTISITGNTTICSGNSTTLTANGSVNSYTWNTTSNNQSIIDNPTITTSYTVIGSNGICTNSATSTVSVNALPTLVVSNSTICAGQQATVNVLGATGITVTPTPITTFSNYFICPTLTIQGIYTVTVNGTDGVCQNTALGFITVNNNPTITVTSTNVCLGNTATLTANGATTYTWSTNSNNQSISDNPLVTTSYTVTGKDNGCSAGNTATITINQLPTLIATATQSNICAGQTTNLNVSGATTYTWSNGINGNSQSVAPLVATIYSVTGTDFNNCTNTVIATTTVNVTQTPTVTVFANPSAICAGQATTLTATGATSYTWSSSTLTTSTIITPSLSTTTNFVVSGATNGCNAQIKFVVVGVTPTPSVIITTTNITTGCANLCVNFNAIVTPTDAIVDYNFGDASPTSTINNHCYITAGNYTTTASASVLGCSSLTYTMPTTINVITSPIANFTITEGAEITLGSAITLNNTSINNLTNNWGFCDNSTSTITNVSYTPIDTGNCCIELVTNNGTCVDGVTKCVKVSQPSTVTIPNVFTPNGDGKNDVFKITANGIKTLTCTIFDRWGLKMAQFTDVNGSWNGTTTSGIEVSSGTYFYILNYTNLKNETITEKGYLTIFKD